MTFEEELLTILNQIPGAIEKAFTAFVERHPGHANQKTHGNRFGGYGTTKESLRRLKDDKEARERYKQSARKRQAGSGESFGGYESRVTRKLNEARSALGKVKNRSAFTGNTAAYGRHKEEAESKIRDAFGAVTKHKVDIKKLTGEQFKKYQKLGDAYNRLRRALDERSDR